MLAPFIQIFKVKESHPAIRFSLPFERAFEIFSTACEMSSKLGLNSPLFERYNLLRNDKS